MASNTFSFDIRPSSARKCGFLSVSIRLTRPSGSETGIKPSWVSCAPKTSNESFWIGRRDGKVNRSALSDRPRAQSQDGKVFPTLGVPACHRGSHGRT
jgi:hypothetical protein